MRTSTKALLGLLLLGLVGLGAVGVRFLHAAGREEDVRRQLAAPTDERRRQSDASVTVVCQADLTKGMVTIQATGLAPKGVYTVWLVKKNTRHRAGQVALPAHRERREGFGNLMADVANCKDVVAQRLEILSSWQQRQGYQGAVVVFTGDLSKLMQGKRVKPGVEDVRRSALLAC